MADTPHFALPFRISGKAAAVNEQDSLDDIAACVQAVLLTEIGEREDEPDFGIVDRAFSQLPLDPDEVVQAVDEWESRAALLAEEDPDLLDIAVARVRLIVGVEEV